MNCEQAQALLSARLDDELSPDDRARLQVHLDECAACRAVDQANRLLDADLRRTFSRRRLAATRVAERAVAALAVVPGRRPRRGQPWLAMLASAAAGFALAVLLFRPWPGRLVEVPAPAARPTVALAVATGPVEIQAPGQEAWQEIAAGAQVAIGCRVRTGPKTRCEFRTAEGSEVRLNTNTEVILDQERQIGLTHGQILAVVARAAVPFQVQVPDATVTALGTEFDILCRPAEVVVTVLEGATRLQTPKEKQPTEVKAGERVRLVQGRVTEKQAAHNLVQATAWVHEILVRKGRDNPELTRRINDLFAQIGQTKTNYLSEEEIRGLGVHCVVPLTRFLQSERSRQPPDEGKRVVAARILADLAPVTSIPDFIGLLADPDPSVRFYAARGLERLTGEMQGMQPADWRNRDAAVRDATRQKWDAWWQANKRRFPGVS